MCERIYIHAFRSQTFKKYNHRLPKLNKSNQTDVQSTIGSILKSKNHNHRSIVVDRSINQIERFDQPRESSFGRVSRDEIDDMVFNPFARRIFTIAFAPIPLIPLTLSLSNRRSRRSIIGRDQQGRARAEKARKGKTVRKFSA